MLQIRTKVVTEGTKPNRRYHARLEVGVQGFAVLPVYDEIDDDNPEASAQWMAEMLRKAMQRIIDEDSEIVE